MQQPKPIINNTKPIADLVIEDLQARKNLGKSRYGTYLQAFNGRDSLQDAYEELLDGAQYIRQEIEQRKLDMNYPYPGVFEVLI